jgi:hypothetical protein
VLRRFCLLIALVGCGATTRPIPDDVGPLPARATAQIAGPKDAGASTDAARATLATHESRQPAGCVDAQHHPLRIRQVGVDRFIAPKQVLTIVQSEHKTTTSAQVDPVTGVQAGYNIVDIGEGSCLEALGLRTGDLVRSINGRDLVDWSSVVLSMQQTQRDNRAVVRIERGGQSMTIVYELTN